MVAAAAEASWAEDGAACDDDRGNCAACAWVAGAGARAADEASALLSSWECRRDREDAWAADAQAVSVQPVTGRAHAASIPGLPQQGQSRRLAGIGVCLAPEEVAGAVMVGLACCRGGGRLKCREAGW